MSEADDIRWLKAQLVDLQSQLAFQEDTIQTLNDVVTGQQRQIEQLNELCNQQKIMLEHMSDALGKHSGADKPPHY